MTTRASTARGQDKQLFQGRVRKWRKQWDLASDTAKYKLLKWVPTDERTEDRIFPRFPNLQPELSKISGAPRAQPVFAHSSTSSPGNPPATIAAPGSTVHPHRILPDYAATPMLDAPAQPVPQMQMVDLSNNAA